LMPSGTINAPLKPETGVVIPDSKLAREVTELVKDTESLLLFHHSSRVYYWGALTGKRRGLHFDPELLYAGAMFHDMGLAPQYASAHERFEVDSANAARDFLRSRGIAEREIETVWTAAALHTTPGVPPHIHPVIALVTAGVEMDVLGIAFSEFTDVEREAVVRAHPRPGRFKEEIIRARRQGPLLPAREFLPRDPRLCLAQLGPGQSAHCLWLSARQRLEGIEND
jgi:HD domain